MKRLFLVILVTVALLVPSASACSLNQSIAGVWSDDDGNCYLFYNNGAFYFSGIPSVEGTYSFKDSKITFSLHDNVATSITADCSYEGNNTLVIQNPTSAAGEQGYPITVLNRITPSALPKSLGSNQFYAHVIGVNETSLHVKGLSINDVNHRGEFTLSSKNLADKRSILDANGNSINFVDITEGSLVLIAYRGPVYEVFPAIIPEPVFVCMLQPKPEKENFTVTATATMTFYD